MRRADIGIGRTPIAISRSFGAVQQHRIALDVGALGPRGGKHARPLRRSADRRAALAQSTSSSAATIWERCAACAHRTLRLCHLITKARQTVIWPACAGGINPRVEAKHGHARIGHGFGPSERRSSRRIARRERSPQPASDRGGRSATRMSSVCSVHRDCTGAGGRNAGGAQSGESASEQSAAAHVSSSRHAVRLRTSSIRSASSPYNKCISPTVVFEIRYELEPTVDPGSSCTRQS